MWASLVMPPEAGNKLVPPSFSLRMAAQIQRCPPAPTTSHLVSHLPNPGFLSHQSQILKEIWWNRPVHLGPRLPAAVRDVLDRVVANEARTA